MPELGNKDRWVAMGGEEKKRGKKKRSELWSGTQGVNFSQPVFIHTDAHIAKVMAVSYPAGSMPVKSE